MKKSGKRPFILGITGSIGSGKSAVGRYLSEMGIPVIDTDKLVHELLSSDTVTIKAIVEQFGEGVLAQATTDQNGSKDAVGKESACSGPWKNHAIDRKKLGQLVFASPQERRKLEQIVHPNTILALRRAVDGLGDIALVAVQVPLLFESKLQDEYDEVWTVFVDDKTLRERIKQRDHLSDAEIDGRLAAQLPQEEKIKAADQTIDNSKSEEETRKQVKLLVEKILPKAGKNAP
jgi:dephospho-CoA kinase